MVFMATGNCATIQKHHCQIGAVARGRDLRHGALASSLKALSIDSIARAELLGMAIETVPDLTRRDRVSDGPMRGARETTMRNRSRNVPVPKRGRSCVQLQLYSPLLWKLCWPAIGKFRPAPRSMSTTVRDFYRMTRQRNLAGSHTRWRREKVWSWRKKPGALSC